MCAILKSFFRLLWDLIMYRSSCTPDMQIDGSAVESEFIINDSNESSLQLPLRVIHLSDTLSSRAICFQRPRDWSFHVISHTWSKGLRDLSEKIGKEVRRHQLAELENRSGSKSCIFRAYDLAFREANFGGEPCFEELLRFFELLAADRVEDIWIDAMCINQTDTTEKSREIGRMGEYYKKSKGCYVLTHGIDQGYKMWKKVGAVPRWFTRVWTLQELVLPQNLMFVATGLHPTTIAYINYCVLKWGVREVGFCKCTLARVLLHAGLYTAWQDAGALHNISERQIICGTRECQECGTLVIREACCSTLEHLERLQGAETMEPIYFIERAAYFEIASVDAKIGIPLQAPLSYKGMGNFFEDQNALLVKLQKQAELTYCRPNVVIREIANRQCSVEEDRVLSVLGLLDVQDTSQLRVGMTLREQIVALAKAKLRSGDQDFLIEMMAIDKQGCYSMQWMSWAPDFCTNDKRCSDTLESVVEQGVFKRCVEVTEVTQEGKLRLEGAKVARVRVCVDTSGMQITHGARSSTTLVFVKFEAWGSDDQGLKMDIDILKHDVFHGGMCVAAANRYVLEGQPQNPALIQFDAWFLLLATFDGTTAVPAAGTLALICLSKAGSAHAADANLAALHDLHKVGLMDLGSASGLVFDNSLPCLSNCCSLAGTDQLEDAYFNCSLPPPPLKLIINKDTFEIQQVDLEV